MSDPFRYDGGQYRHSPEGAGMGEQFLSGVNAADSPANASWKVQRQRSALGLDIYTGLPAPRRYSRFDTGETVSAPTGAARPPRDPSALNAVFKLIVLWPAALGVAGIMILAALACLDAAWRGRDPAAGLARFVAAKIAKDAGLAPASAYLPIKQIEAAARGDALWRTLVAAKPTQKDLAAAYLCQIDPACAALAEARAGSAVFWRAEHFLRAHARKGNAQAAMDMCLLPLLTLRSEPVLAARDACAAAAKESGSGDARAVSDRLRDSWWAHGARAIEIAARVFSVDQPGSSDAGRADAKP